ncbi:MAG: peptidylprolyl isomerase [Crocinitomix sp. MedPE-SWsnd]|jgi:FKBP-type peptidyl-prolyl cis-trans isomerase FklB|nr:MAG: peptidylprolyl isomerase [Crocinitomix sp. MedPE-SWsnd]
MSSKNDASYGVGMSIAQSLENQNLEDINLDEFVKGISDIFNKAELRFSPEEANMKIQSYLNEVNESKFAQFKTAGAEFLAENAKKDGITTLESGLQYEIVENGSGDKPSAEAQVTVHYHGTLTDGTVFDSSIERGTPATFGVNQVIKGWTEALQLMPAGSKWRLYIPEDLAYGANPHPGGPIKPYMALIFDVELISIA